MLPKDIACDQSVDNKEFLDKENSEAEHQFSVCSSVLGKMVEFDCIGFRLLFIGISLFCLI